VLLGIESGDNYRYLNERIGLISTVNETTSPIAVSDYGRFVGISDKWARDLVQQQ
jgi:hypothetical protein